MIRTRTSRLVSRWLGELEVGLSCSMAFLAVGVFIYLSCSVAALSTCFFWRCALADMC
jgi:hypothetical protein